MDKRRIIDRIRELQATKVVQGQKALSEKLESPGAYLLTYSPILDHFRKIKNFTDEELLLSATILYGWMPTSLKIRLRPPFAGACRVLNRARQGLPLQEDDYACLKQLINNSIVGTSKLLHFIRPAEYPIWDSRICRAIAGTRPLGQVHDDPEVYVVYRARMLELVAASDHKETLDALRAQTSLLAEATDMRLYELMLFYSVERGAP